jgi:hypothetical protein
VLEDHPPRVKTEKPAVNRMITHIASAAGVEYTDWSQRKPHGMTI